MGRWFLQLAIAISVLSLTGGLRIAHLHTAHTHAGCCGAEAACASHDHDHAEPSHSCCGHAHHDDEPADEPCDEPDPAPSDHTHSCDICAALALLKGSSGLDTPPAVHIADLVAWTPALPPRAMPRPVPRCAQVARGPPTA